MRCRAESTPAAGKTARQDRSTSGRGEDNPINFHAHQVRHQDTHVWFFTQLFFE